MLDIVRREDEEVKDEISNFHAENPPAKCMPTFTGLVFKTYNNIKKEMPTTDTTTQNYAVTPLPTSKSDTYILNITQKQHQCNNKSDTGTNKTTPVPHFIDIPNPTPIDITDIPNHTPIDITDIANHTAIDITDIANHTAIVFHHMDKDSGKEPDREIPESTGHSFDQIAAKYADVDLDQLLKINVDSSEDSYINLDELADIDIPDLDFQTV